MLTNRASGLYRLHAGAQVGSVVVYFSALHGVLNFTNPRGLALPGTPYLAYGLIIVVGLLGEAWTRPERLRWMLELSRRNLRRVSLRQFISVVLTLSVFLVATQDHRISRIFFAAFMVGILPLLHLTNLLFPRRLLKWVLRAFERKQANILVIEDRKAVAFFEEKIRLGIYPGMAVSGYLTLEKPQFGSCNSSSRWLGTLDRLEEVVAQYGIRQIVMPSLSFEAAVGRKLRFFCEAKGVRLVLINDAPKRLGCPLTMTDIGGMEILSPRAEPLEDPLNQTMKRVADVIFASLVLLLIFPFTTLFAWICQLRQSRGPLFFTQERSGQGGALFRIVKYRTLHVNNPDEAKQVTAEDGRLFPLGRFMRRTSIDEIPQFWNVLRGEMSLVGPRPHLPAHDVQFADISTNYLVRTFVKPGITGLAQIKGYRGETRTRAQVRNRVRWDVIYLERWSVALDLWIVFKTAVQVLLPLRGAA